MNLVEKHIISKSHPFFKELDELAFQCKNLYNSLLYLTRQFYKETEKYMGFYKIYHEGKKLPIWNNCKLPKKVCNKVVYSLDTNYKSYFAAVKAFRIDPSNFTGPPKPPQYKDSIKGRMVLFYERDAINPSFFKKSGKIKLSGTNIEIQTQLKDFSKIKQVRVVPGNQQYTIEVVYERLEQAPKISDNVAAIDLGVNNLATVSFNDGKNPFFINGRPIKSINQFYNKNLSKLQANLPKGIYTSKAIYKLTNKRNNKIQDYLHKASTYLVNQLVSKNVSKLIIGYNQGWKQDINIGKKSNQNFVSIPFYKFISMLEYKCRLQGIEVVRQEESYTSKCSFLDNEEICKHEKYLGKRIKRGLFKNNSGKLINADLNGSYNIMRKVVPHFKGIEGVAVHPKSVTI